MNTRSDLLLFSMFLFSMSAFADLEPSDLANKDVHICYFSLNSDKEFKTMQNLVEAINQKTGRKILVKEFQTEGEPVEQSFRKMVESGEPCDSLVISGHHTGSFGGERAQDQLHVDFLENLACEPQNKAWFQQLRAVWLQGCRTLGVGSNERIDENPEYDPQAHTARVAPLLGADNLRLDMAELNNDFTITLDDSNPLSSRYLRIFPRSSVFGWTKTAPGIVSASELSVPLHLANIMKLTKGEHIADEVVLINSQNFSKFNLSQAKSMANAIDTVTQNHCKDEKACVQAWNDQGHMMKNNDLTSYESLASSANPVLSEAMVQACRMRDDKNFENALDAFQSSLKRKDLTKLNFNAIVAFAKHAQNDPDQKKRVDTILSTSDVIKDVIHERISSPRSGIIAKIDAYSFYRDHIGGRIPQLEEKIRQIAFSRKLLSNPDNSYESRDIRETVLDSLIKNKIIALNKSGVDELKKLPNFGPVGLVRFLNNRFYEDDYASIADEVHKREIPELLSSKSPGAKSEALLALIRHDPSAINRHEESLLQAFEEGPLEGSLEELSYRINFDAIKDKSRLSKAIKSIAKTGTTEQKFSALTMMPKLGIPKSEYLAATQNFLKNLPPQHASERDDLEKKLIKGNPAMDVYDWESPTEWKKLLSYECNGFDDNRLLLLAKILKKNAKLMQSTDEIKKYLAVCETSVSKAIKDDPDDWYAKQSLVYLQIARDLLQGKNLEAQNPLTMESNGQSFSQLLIYKNLGVSEATLQKWFIESESKHFNSFSHGPISTELIDSPSWLETIQKVADIQKSIRGWPDEFAKIRKQIETDLEYRKL